jgi:hypothetical protein
MSGNPFPAVHSDVTKRYVPRIEAHLARLAEGHDPLGHLFGVERLARAARAEWWAVLHGSTRERPGR